MQIKKCTEQDVPRLAMMNKRLIEDEKSGNQMNLSELENRMESFIRNEYDAYFFEEDNTILGYALVKRTSTPPYLRQFYIERDFRRKHYGKRAFFQLIEHIQADSIDVDVLPWNERGHSFWKSCGFDESCISMRYNK